MSRAEICGGSRLVHFCQRRHDIIAAGITLPAILSPCRYFAPRKTLNGNERRIGILQEAAVSHCISRLPFLAFICATVFAFPAVALAKDPYARPAGINPTTATLQDVLAKAKKADGSDTPYRTRVVQGAANAWGLKGSLRSLQVGDDYRSTLDFGAISWSNGRVSGQSWRQNPNGLVTLLHDVTGEEDIDFEALTRYVSRPSSQSQLLGDCLLYTSDAADE